MTILHALNPYILKNYAQKRRIRVQIRARIAGQSFHDPVDIQDTLLLLVRLQRLVTSTIKVVADRMLTLPSFNIAVALLQHRENVIT